MSGCYRADPRVFGKRRKESGSLLMCLGGSDGSPKTSLLRTAMKCIAVQDAGQPSVE